ncbi:MarR family transcriptional regulator [soil metagenome]
MPRSVPHSSSANEPRWLDAQQQQSWRAFLLGTTLLFDRLDDDLRRHHGASMVEYEILVRLSETDGRLRMAQLADALAHSRSRVTHTIKRMEIAGLVQRTDSPEDKRGVFAVITDDGRRLLEEMAPTHVAGVRDHLVDLADPADFEALGRLMNAVADQLIAGHPDRELR